MPTAKSYENMEQVGQPFESNGKMYIRVKGKCPRCGGSGHYSYNPMDGTVCFQCRGRGVQVMDVRWYTDGQRASMDRAAERRAETKAQKQEERRVKFAARNAFGFGEAGYITLYKGNQEVISEYFKSFTIDEAGHRAAWYNTLFNWYTPSKIAVPQNLPEGVEAIRLNWEAVRDETDEENLAMRDKDFVAEYVQQLITEPSSSRYQGEVGAWIQRDLTVQKNIELESRYGISHMHIMTDGANIYVWITGNKNIAEGTNVSLKMKIKEHKEYKGVQQTVVWYCRELK